MAIPNYQAIMLPVLKFSTRVNEFSNKDAIQCISKEFSLTQEEINELQPNGNETLISNRVRWAIFYLKRATLLESTNRGVFKITARGSQSIKENPSKIDFEYLRQFPEFVEYIKSTNVIDGQKISSSPMELANDTPDTRLEQSYLLIRENLIRELLDKVKKSSPKFFEKLVIRLLVEMGYGGSIKDAGSAVGKTGDEGIDGVIKEDFLGLGEIFIQAKKWEGTVGSKEVRDFAGALQAKRGRKGIFITTGIFSNEARNFISKIDNKIVLIDGNKLSEYLFDYNIGVNPEISYEVKRIDNDYFEEDD